MRGMKRLRVYADTSVFGGCFDPGFEVESREFFDEVRQGRFTLLVSDVLGHELARAPEEVRQVLTVLPAEQIEFLESSEESEGLRQAYVDALWEWLPPTMPLTSPWPRLRVRTWW